MRADPYTGFWGEDAEADHQRYGGVIVSAELAARTPGAFVLRKPGIYRKVGHIVISDGTGGTVEAMSSNRGVVQASLNGRWWDYGILVPGVQYFMNETPVELTPPHRVLRITTPLLRGAMVEAVQRALSGLGYKPGSIDGIYGSQAANAVSAFQSDQGLVVDGEVSDETLNALDLEWNA